MKTTEFPSHSTLDFASISSFVIEDVEYVDGVVPDGRANRLAHRAPGPGGMAWYAIEGIRRFDTAAAVALAGLIGGLDARQALRAVRPLRCNTRWLFPVAGKRTNRSLVVADQTQRLIVRKEQQIDVSTDLNPFTREALGNLVRQARSCLLGNLPGDLTREWIAAGNDAGTYVALGPGSRQWVDLETYQPMALCLNFEEAQQVTGLGGRPPHVVFDSLVGRCGARHTVVMTGGGTHPTHVADLITGRNWQLAPIPLDTIRDRKAQANCLGTGDVMAGVVTFLLGLPPELPTGEDLFEIVRFGQDVALAHLTESVAWGAEVLKKYRRLHVRLSARSTRPAAAAGSQRVAG